MYLNVGKTRKENVILLLIKLCIGWGFTPTVSKASSREIPTKPEHANITYYLMNMKIYAEPSNMKRLSYNPRRSPLSSDICEPPRFRSFPPYNVWTSSPCAHVFMLPSIVSIISFWLFYRFWFPIITHRSLLMMMLSYCSHKKTILKQHLLGRKTF